MYVYTSIYIYIYIGSTLIVHLAARSLDPLLLSVQPVQIRLALLAPLVLLAYVGNTNMDIPGEGP